MKENIQLKLDLDFPILPAKPTSKKKETLVIDINYFEKREKEKLIQHILKHAKRF